MTEPSVPITIYHNPACGTSRKTLALIRSAGVEPTVIEYLKMTPDRATLTVLLQRMGMRPRQLLREKEPLYAQLGLAATHWSDEQLIEHLLAHPVLINRPSWSRRGASDCAGQQRWYWRSWRPLRRVQRLRSARARHARATRCFLTRRASCVDAPCLPRVQTDP
jgi:arsenate reductase (glutaredoxin)